MLQGKDKLRSGGGAGTISDRRWPCAGHAARHSISEFGDPARSRFSEGSACACLPKKMENVDGGVTRDEGSWEEERGLYLEKTWEMPSLMVEAGFTVSWLPSVDKVPRQK